MVLEPSHISDRFLNTRPLKEKMFLTEAFGNDVLPPKECEEADDYIESPSKMDGTFDYTQYVKNFATRLARLSNEEQDDWWHTATETFADEYAVYSKASYIIAHQELMDDATTVQSAAEEKEASLAPLYQEFLYRVHAEHKKISGHTLSTRLLQNTIAACDEDSMEEGDIDIQQNLKPITTYVDMPDTDPEKQGFLDKHLAYDIAHAPGIKGHLGRVLNAFGERNNLARFQERIKAQAAEAQKHLPPLPLPTEEEKAKIAETTRDIVTAKYMLAHGNELLTQAELAELNKRSAANDTVGISARVAEKIYEDQYKYLRPTIEQAVDDGIAHAQAVIAGKVAGMHPHNPRRSNYIEKHNRGAGFNGAHAHERNALMGSPIIVFHAPIREAIAARREFWAELGAGRLPC